MLSDGQIAAIHRFVHEEDDLSERLKSLSRLGPEELDYYLDLYNWDDGFEIPTAIARHLRCDQALALRLFWLADGLAWYTRQAEPDPHQQDWDTFCRLLTEGLLSGRFPRCGELRPQPRPGAAVPTAQGRHSRDPLSSRGRETSSAAAIPEPATLALAGIGFSLLGVRFGRRRKAEL